MAEQKNERRQYAARRISARLRVCFADHPGQHFYSVNISQSGLLIQAPHLWPIDSFVGLEFFLPPDQNPISILGRVARHTKNEGTDFLGVQILEIEPDSRDRWLEYIAKIETLSSQQGERSSAQYILKEKHKHGKFIQSFVYRFDTPEKLIAFMSPHMISGGMIIQTPMTKTPGDEVTLTFVHPTTQKVFNLTATVTPAIDALMLSVPHSGLPLKFKDFDETKKRAFVHFMKNSV